MQCTQFEFIDVVQNTNEREMQSSKRMMATTRMQCDQQLGETHEKARAFGRNDKMRHFLDFKERSNDCHPECAVIVWYPPC